ncbi:hypothetical protein AAE478_002550 [Parahypoxylon ruwenzoriense]
MRNGGAKPVTEGRAPITVKYLTGRPQMNGSVEIHDRERRSSVATQLNQKMANLVTNV